MNCVSKIWSFHFPQTKTLDPLVEKEAENYILIITNGCKTMRLLELQYFKY